MRKIYTFLLSLLFFFVWRTAADAQVNTYLFSQSTASYTAITGGTVLGVPTGNGTTALDDAIFNIPSASFPFPFTFNGVGYTGCNVSTNGYITFGSTAPSGTGYTPISSTTGYEGAIAAWGRDINSIFNISTQTGELRWEVVGTAPNREVVIQWSKFRPSYSGSTTSAYVFDFQIRLSESNAINIIYGGNLGYLLGSTTYSGSGTSGPQIGLRGTTNADYNSRTNATGVAFTASSASTANSNSQSFNTVSATPGMPTNGLTYTWLPPPPCVPGSLAGGTTNASVTNACVGVDFTLTVAGASFGTGLTYQWEYSTDGITFNPVSGATTENLTINQAAATYYQRVMTCGASSATSTPVLIGQNPPSACYCDVIFDQDTEPITLVDFANINNTSSATINGSPDQEDFTSIVGNVSKGQSYTITVKGNTGGNFTTHINVYIDFNQDGDFTDPGEDFYIGTIVNSTGTDAVQATGSILIPASALDGTTRMRVIKKYNVQAAPCNTIGFGQAEDYTLNITTPPCAVPSGITVTSVGTTSADVAVTATGTIYVEYGPPGFTPGTGTTAGGGTVVSGAASPITLTGLTPNTLYEVYVRQDCGGGIFSANGTGGNFTVCGPVATFPFTETFEATSGTRPCWDRQMITGPYNWTYGAGAGNGGVTTAHGGSVNAQYFGSFYGAETALLVSPQLDLSGLTFGADLEFWMINPVWFGDINELRVYYSNSPAGPWTLIPGAVYTSAVNSWTKVEIDDLPGISSSYYIAFEGTQLFGFGIGIDDVTVKAAPSCRAPKNVSVLGTTSTSVEVSFTSLGSAFIVEYGAPGFTPGTGNTAGTGGTLVFGASSPIAITGLGPNTIYDFYVRQICVPGTPGDYSTNVLAQGTTLCTAVNIPYVQNFESATVPAMPTCTSVQDVNGNSGSFWAGAGGGTWETYTDTDPLAYVSPSKSLLYFYDFNDLTRPADDWFYLQGLNLIAGTSYRLKFFYKAIDGVNFPEKLEVKYGMAATASAMTSGTLFTNANITSVYGNAFDSVRVDFTPAATGVYYIGFHAFSNPDEWGILLDDISVKVAPLVDVGVTGITAAPVCPATNGVINAIVRNYNLTPINFATYPVTITGTISGVSGGTITATINTGTLAPGASDTIALTGFNYIAGLYNITVATSSPDDPETANDSYTTSFYVNPSPAVAVVTPAAPVICVGDVVQLTTQFTTPPPPPTTHPAVSSGAISVAVPDNLAAGATHTLAVSGVPAGATVLGISVTLNMTHTWINDMQINLKAPNGKVLNLFNRKGGLFEANLLNTVISSSSTTSIPTAGAPFTGTYAADAGAGVGPTGYVSDVTGFAGLYSIPNGNWTLALRDNALFDVGNLTSWSITIIYGFPHPRVTWAPTTGLFTNAAATTGYFGTNLYSVYAKPTTTTTYTVTTTDSVTGCTSTQQVVVTVNQLPVINITPFTNKICLSDQTVSLSATPVGGTWSGIGVTGNTFNPPLTAVGTYTLAYTYTDPQGCTNTGTIAAKVEDCPERMILLRDNAVSVFPNPNDGQFIVRMNSTLYNKLTLKVYTANGNLVHTRALDGLYFGRRVDVDLRFLPSGSYMVQLSYIGGPRTSEKAFKVIIAH